MIIEDKILLYLEDKPNYVFCIKDMEQFGTYKAVAKAIERLTLVKKIRRIIQGIYYYPAINRLFNMEYPPKIDDIAQAIARNNSWKIVPTGETALNMLGLSTQIPVKYIFLSSGNYTEYKINNITIEFKNTAQKNINNSQLSALIFQSLKSLGKDNITAEIIINIKKRLKDDDYNNLKNDMKNAPIWMHKYIYEIMEA